MELITFKKLFGLGALMTVLLAVLRIVFYKGFDLTSGVVIYTQWFLILVLTIALARRTGVLNFIEALIVCGVWLLMALFFDFIITSFIVGIKVFTDWHWWVGYVIMIVGIFLFHKKRHIAIRKQQAAK